MENRNEAMGGQPHPSPLVAVILVCALSALAIDYAQAPFIFASNQAMMHDQVYWFLKPYYSSFWETLWEPDRIYPSFVSRLVTAFAHLLNVFPTELGVFYQVAASALKGAMLGVLFLAPGKALIESLWVRIALFVALISIGALDVKFLHNIGYVQVFVVALVASAGIASPSLTYARTAFAAAPLALTKTFIAPALLLSAWAAWRTNGVTRIALITLSAMIAFDVAFSAYHYINTGMGRGDFAGLGSSLSLGDRLMSATAPLAHLGLMLLPGATVMMAIGIGAIIAAAIAALCTPRMRWWFAGMLVFAALYSLAAGLLAPAQFNLNIVREGAVMRYVFPLAALNLLFLAVAVDQGMRRLSRIPSPLPTAIAVLAVLAISPAWARMINRATAGDLLLASGGNWHASALEFYYTREGDAAQSAYCVRGGWTVRFPLPRGGCRLLAGWEPSAQGGSVDIPVGESFSLAAPAGAIRSMLIAARSAYTTSEPQRFTARALNAEGVILEEREVIAVLSPSGVLVDVQFSRVLSDVSRLELSSVGPFRVIMSDVAQGLPVAFIYGLPPDQAATP